MSIASAAVSQYAPPTEKPGRDPSLVPASVKASIRVLVVDDDRTLREGCASVLQVEGYNVTVSGRGDEALELVKRRKFDLVLCDLYMTPVPGTEIGVLLVKLPSALSVVSPIVTGPPFFSRPLVRSNAWSFVT